MATSEQFFLIILDSPSETQRAAVHARVKKATGAWWHKLGDVWIVRGGSATEWRDRLQTVFKSGSGGVLVLKLPGTDEIQGWAYFGPDATERVAWLGKYYTKG